mgnify:CR=1 FL=1
METFSGRGFLFSFRIYILASMILLRGSASNNVEVLLTPIPICPPEIFRFKSCEI